MECKEFFTRDDRGLTEEKYMTSNDLYINIFIQIFSEEGVKISQHIYLAMLRDEVVPRVKRSVGNSGVILHQDGATSHAAKMVQS